MLRCCRMDCRVKPGNDEIRGATLTRDPAVYFSID
jgi:hypothetical protein